MRIIRNEEAHELDVQKEKGCLAPGFIAGMAITITLHTLVKAQNIK